MSKTLALASAFVSTVVVANALVAYVGPVPVGFGLIAPAGVFVAGMAFVLRDLLHESTSRPGAWTAGSVAVGGLISLAMGQGMIALAGAVAFVVSEALDYAVFRQLRDRAGLLVGGVASNVVGVAADSLVFLSIAFGSLEYLSGQMVGKAWVTFAFALGYVAWRRAR